MDEAASPGVFWPLFGTIGGLIFYGRFYVQWIVSERMGRSVIPIAFWYMSSVGSLMLMTYAFASQSPLGALGQSLNIIIYSRNLIHIWREEGRLSEGVKHTVHICVAVIATTAFSLMVWTWWREIELNAEKPTDETQQVWIWLVVGIVGYVLFACRFIIQWITTEWKKKSVIPRSFWYFSIVAASLMAAAFVQRGEWVFAAGMFATILIYGRNIWFVHNRDDEEPAS